MEDVLVFNVRAGVMLCSGNDGDCGGCSGGGGGGGEES